MILLKQLNRKVSTNNRHLTRKYLKVNSRNYLFRLGDNEMSVNETPILKTIMERRSITQFKASPISNDQLSAILEAGRWAPSWTNTQPWKLIVVKDPEMRRKLTEIAVTITGAGIEEAQVVIVVTVDPKADPYHYVEDGAAVTLNMALAAHSLGLSSFWVGVFDNLSENGASEITVKTLLGIPESYRVISILPIGTPAITPKKTRKPLEAIVCKESFGK